MRPGRCGRPGRRGRPAPPSAAAAVTLATGDSRRVTQPSVPATCTTLSAALATSNEQFSSGAETSPPDTAGIQAALNSCSGTGKAVVLAPSGTEKPSCPARSACRPA